MSLFYADFSRERRLTILRLRSTEAAPSDVQKTPASTFHGKLKTVAFAEKTLKTAELSSKFAFFSASTADLLFAFWAVSNDKTILTTRL